MTGKLNLRNNLNAALSSICHHLHQHQQQQQQQPSEYEFVLIAGPTVTRSSHYDVLL
jgi:hypothetical protein